MIEELVDAGSLYSRSLDALVQELTADAQHLLSTDGDEAEMLEATLQAIAETQKQLLHMRKTTNNSLTAVNELQRSLHAKYSILYRDATGQRRDSSGSTGASNAVSRGKENGQGSDANLQPAVSLSSWKQEPSSQLPPRRPPLRDFQLSSATLNAMAAAAAAAPVPLAVLGRSVTDPMSASLGFTALERTTSLGTRSDGADAEPANHPVEAVEPARDFSHLGNLFVTESSYASLPKMMRAKISLQDLHACLDHLQSHLKASGQETCDAGPWLSEGDWRRLFPDVPLRELTTMLVLLKKIKGEVLEDRQGYRIVQ